MDYGLCLKCFHFNWLGHESILLVEVLEFPCFLCLLLTNYIWSPTPWGVSTFTSGSYLPTLIHKYILFLLFPLDTLCTLESWCTFISLRDVHALADFCLSDNSNASILIGHLSLVTWTYELGGKQFKPLVAVFLTVF